MKTYYVVYFKVLGGDWQDYRIGLKQFQTDDLASAICMADAIKGPIHEAMVVRVSEGEREFAGKREILKTYELVE